MRLNNLKRIVSERNKRVGRGLGSGKGKTAGRGQKGQKVRGTMPLAAVGAGLVLYKKLPYLRGWSRRGTNSTRTPKPVLIKLSDLNKLKSKSTVDISLLIENKIIKGGVVLKRGIKVVGGGELKVALNVKLPVTKKAKEAIEKAGGKIV